MATCWRDSDDPRSGKHGSGTVASTWMGLVFSFQESASRDCPWAEMVGCNSLTAKARSLLRLFASSCSSLASSRTGVLSSTKPSAISLESSVRIDSRGASS